MEQRNAVVRLGDTFDRCRRARHTSLDAIEAAAEALLRAEQARTRSVDLVRQAQRTRQGPRRQA